MSPRHALEYVAYRAGSVLLRLLPLQTARRFAALVAGAIFDRGGKRVRWTLTNLRIALPDHPESELRRIGRESYVNFALNVVDFVFAQRWTEDEIRERVRFEGLEHVHDALAKGHGAIAVSLHLGNFELGTTAAPLYGLPVAVVGRPMGNALLYREVLRGRTRTGATVIDRRRAARSILRALRDGRLVAILNDQYMRRSRAVFVPLFGRRCSTSAGAATLALRASAPILPLHMRRVGPDSHVVRFGPPLEFHPSGDRSKDIVELTALTNAAIESFIRSYPEQWLWGHRRFRHSPDLEGDLYV
jgi:KDO2-lipid IV(A) lauroyltransferase